MCDDSAEEIRAWHESQVRAGLIEADAGEFATEEEVDALRNETSTSGHLRGQSGASPLDLDLLSNRLVNGLQFCHTVYSLFEELQSQPGGVSKLRSRQGLLQKRLVEELIPLARYIQARYSEGRRIRVRWSKGTQRGDAVLWSRGTEVTYGGVPRRRIAEITTASHPHEYLSREILETSGGSFGVKGFSRKGREILSEPYTHTPDTKSSDLACQILSSLTKKKEKAYPVSTVLIINCIADGLILQEEWHEAVERVRAANEHRCFHEVFVVELVMSHSATL